MWFFSQSSGEIHHDNAFVGEAYAGNGGGKNNPAMQQVHNVGPLPQGLYQMDAPVKHPELGPFAIPLKPSMDNRMFGRSAFYIHGDSLSNPGNASEGCIVTGLDVRTQIWNSDDHALTVTS